MGFLKEDALTFPISLIFSENGEAAFVANFNPMFHFLFSDRILWEAELAIEVEDSGPGVSEEQRAHLFDRFYRAEGSRSRTTGGSGLGLSICKNIAEAHGGSIESGHSPLGGLSIRVHLPA